MVMSECLFLFVIFYDIFPFHLFTATNFRGITGDIRFNPLIGDRQNMSFALYNFHPPNLWNLVGYMEQDNIFHVLHSDFLWPDGTLGLSAPQYSQQYIPYCKAG